MISPPVTAWLALNSLALAAGVFSNPKDNLSGLGFSIVVATLSCALLAAGQLNSFFLMEFLMWMVQVVTLTVFISLYKSRRGGEQVGTERDIRDANMASMASSLRMTLAVGVWIWAGGTLSNLVG